LERRDISANESLASLAHGGIDNPERRAIPGFGVASKLGIKPVERPVERNGIRPAEISDSLVVFGAVAEQEGARFLKCGHRYRSNYRPVCERAG
jgi:hypothetical protein